MSELYLGKYDVTYSSIKPEELDVNKLTTFEVKDALEASADLKGSIIYCANRKTVAAALESGREYADFTLPEKVAALLVVLSTRHYIEACSNELRKHVE